ncbi:MAG: cytochrome c biogenesis protein CcdA [Bacteroidales bacterium]|jgi:thiol:disulfide interchange protein DsbD
MRKLIFSLLFVFAFINLFAQTSATWSYSQKDNGDGTIDLIFNAEIEMPWYIYTTEVIKNGPLPTTFEFKNISGFEAIGKLKDVGVGTKKMDKAFKIEVSVFEKSATFIQTIRKTTEGSVKVEGLLSFQTCNGKECLMEEVDVVFDVKGVAIKTISGQDKSQETEDSDKAGASQGMLMFLLIAFAAGLGGVFTPCVFPMIPMTVSFFLSGSGKKQSGIIKGLVFGLSVTLIYTLIGVLVAVFQSTDATDTLGSHWIPNLLFALLFMIFAISFFGAFEITLPTGLANKADAQADKGGYIASFFVAFAMVVVSFSCTGPFVGSILAAAVTGGLALKPILGMFFFGLAFSLPFVLFSFFPSLMKKMPKSGGWLNVVKVVFAFILLGFSLKYLASVDAWFGLGILTRTVFISIWIVLATLLGFYFMGKFKTSHDSDTGHVSTGRLLFAIASFSFAVYLVPGLFGAPLASLSAIIPPADESTFVIGSGSTTSSAPELSGEVVPEGLCGPAKYADPNHKAPYGLPAYFEIEQAVECAKQVNKPVLLSFKAVTCSVCKLMEATVWSDPRVLDILSNKIVLTTLYVDNRTELPKDEQITSTIDGKIKNTLGRKLRDYQVSRFGVASQPFYVLIDKNQEVLIKPVGECSADEFLKFLESGIAEFQKRK